MLQTGRRDLIPHALQLLPPGEKVNAANSSGNNYSIVLLIGLPTYMNIFELQLLSYCYW